MTGGRRAAAAPRRFAVALAASATALTLSAGGATAAGCDSPLVAGLNAFADGTAGRLPPGLGQIGFHDAYDFADCFNLSTIRRLLRMHKTGEIVLPPNILDAFRFKSPGMFNRPNRD